MKEFQCIFDSISNGKISYLFFSAKEKMNNY